MQEYFMHTTHHQIRHTQSILSFFLSLPRYTIIVHSEFCVNAIVGGPGVRCAMRVLGVVLNDIDPTGEREGTKVIYIYKYHAYK